ncbi:MAG: M23 family metallopeptidase [Patescibacteria group bacterium]|nr:M23 family metallopeptidase [Patescibacteria group bacterium]
MNIRLFLYTLVTTIILLPLIANAQLYDDFTYKWNHDTPTIAISGPPEIIFPVEGGAIFYDDFGDGRSGGRTHEANDLMAPKMTKIIAARGGTVSFAPMTEPSYGYMLSIRGDDGYKYNYLHINNDTLGTDDGLGGPETAYAPGISQGVQVVQGQHIAWVGDSGNAENTGPHLHFEIRIADDSAINPYIYLQASLKIFAYDVAEAKTASPTINHDKALTINPDLTSYCSPGSLIRTASISSVYYCGADGKRYVFPNLQTYSTWYDDFSNVEIISLEDIGKISLGGNVTYRPGVKLVKIQTDTRVYAVSPGGTLRLMETPVIAEKYYGKDWNKQVEDIPDTFFSNYKVGKSINN